MKNTVWLIALLLLVASCEPKQQDKQETLYQAAEFTITTNEVHQDGQTAQVISPQEISSNYQSKAHEVYGRHISFKFSINEKDNELGSGHNHTLVIGEEHESPVFIFGQENQRVDNPDTKLPPNYSYTFRVDMRPVLKQFEEKGYYETFDGSRVAKTDFKHVYLAGGAEPLSWDFSNLDEKGLALEDSNNDGIYELTVVLNPYNPNEAASKTWKATVDVSDKPHYESDQKIVDALFNLSLEEARINIEPDSTLRTGAKWGGVWTRDVSYSILLAFAYHEPEVAKISLLKKVKRDRIIQDTGSGGAWPVSSDRTTWALGAWEVYKVTGDSAWLQTAYTVIKNTLDDDDKTLRSATGMYRGESSFLDWREQTYPKWMSNMDIYTSENLGTNVVHYQTHKILVEMAKILGQPYKTYEERAEQIKRAINQQLWMQDKGYYAQYLYGRSTLHQSPRFEALGEALAVLFDVADEEQAKSIVAKSPVTPYGTTCIYPQIPGIPPYHNNGIWPFVQAYWNMAAAKAGNQAVLNHGLAAIYRAGGLFLTNYENMVAQNGDYQGTEINSHRMLWSMAGNLAMVHRVFMGMHFAIDGINFAPVVPEAYSGTKMLTNFTYRQAKLNIEVHGYGNQIKSFTLDGKEQANAHVPTNLIGQHDVKIELANNTMNTEINLVENRFSLANPQTTLTGNRITWAAVSGAVAYQIYQDGKHLKKQTNTDFVPSNTEYAEYTVSAIDQQGNESFVSEPIARYNSSYELRYQLEDYVAKSALAYTNFEGEGFVKTSTTENREIILNISVAKAGTYLLDFRYANGTGPWNTDNNCAIRSLYVNTNYTGVVVMPQRGTDEWSDWGYSNVSKVNLQAGANTLKISLEEWNINMDGEINEALLDYLRIIRMN